MKYVNICLAGFLLFIYSCKGQTPKTSSKDEKQSSVSHNKPAKIKVLNFGTFHMGDTSDENKTEFDERDKENQKKVHEIAQMLASFKPTVIVVEDPPKYDDKLLKRYNQYFKTPEMSFKNPGEVELLAFELGRLSGTKRIYGIDHKLGYNYRIGREIDNKIDPILHDKFEKDCFKFFPKADYRESSTLLEKLKVVE